MTTPPHSAVRDTQNRLIAALSDPGHYPHPVSEVEHVETHISHVVLAGRKAYKIKKPVSLGFLDFSTVDRRRFFCQEELRLNRRLAPELYEEVVAITGSPSAPELGGPGQPFEYAVRMKRFDRDRELDTLLERGELPRTWMDELAARVADFHARVPRAHPSSKTGGAETVVAQAENNFTALEELLEGREDRRRLAHLRGWNDRETERAQPLFDARLRDGFVRECHGDMHLGNMVHARDEIAIFDGIEFNEALRWIDIQNEVAFVTMDLKDRGAPAHAHRFFNAYLEHIGDYEGIALSRFYEVYRAMVRAKVAGIRSTQEGLSARERDETRSRCQRYLALAEKLTAPTSRPALFINHGLSGSGKTTQSLALVEELGAVRVRSDVERKRLAERAGVARASGAEGAAHGKGSKTDDEAGTGHDWGPEADSSGGAAIGTGLYAADISAATYDRLAHLCEAVLRAGYPAVADAAFLERTKRRDFLMLAERLDVRRLILDYRAPEHVLRQRIEARKVRADDASDADLRVLQHQRAVAEPLSADEPALAIDTTGAFPLADIRRTLDQ